MLTLFGFTEETPLPQIEERARQFLANPICEDRLKKGRLLLACRRALGEWVGSIRVSKPKSAPLPEASPPGIKCPCGALGRLGQHGAEWKIGCTTCGRVVVARSAGEATSRWVA